MLLQLLMLGYVLVYIFETETPLVVLLTLAAMLVAASWISLRVSVKDRRRLMPKVLLSVIVGGGLTLIVITQGVLQLHPWYEPRIVVPLAGMIFSNCMNSISLAVERFQSETARGEHHDVARKTALEAALIPITNSLFAVGLVSIPGMMTGQVLAGESPQIAARYQIMVMCMMFASSGLSASISLFLMARMHSEDSESKEIA
jgi:putative ABC transport system permease protein